jgi:plasmid maintenance system antidote protein VapI
MADCLAQKVGGSSESWLRMQASFDSWEHPW